MKNNLLINKENIMKKSIWFVVIIIAVIAIGTISYYQINKDPEELTNIRIGWPVSWIPAGSLTATLIHTDILKSEGLKPEFQKFTSGIPLIESALAGSADVIFIGQVPALSLLNKTDKWQIVARLGDGRAAVIVPKDSTMDSIADLKGKNFSIPFGTLNYMMAIDAFKKNGMDPQKDLNFKNIDVIEASTLIKKGTSKSWGAIDATSFWDPGIAQLEEAGLAKVIDEFRLDGVIVMSKDYYAKNPVAAKNFLKAMIEAYNYYNNNKDQANAWYLTESGLNYTPTVLAKAASLERNNNAKSINDIRLILEQSDLDRIQNESDMGFELGMFKKQLNIKDIIDQSLVNSAQLDIEEGKVLKSIKIIK